MSYKEIITKIIMENDLKEKAILLYVRIKIL
jgi:hypothetical protein